MSKQKTEQSASGEDSGFDRLLRSAKVEVPLPGTFQSEVWRRIAVAQESTLAGRFTRLLDSLMSGLTQPVAASAVILTMISGGLWFGSLGEDPVRDAKLAYVQSVSPFAHAHGGQGR